MEARLFPYRSCKVAVMRSISQSLPRLILLQPFANGFRSRYVISQVEHDAPRIGARMVQRRRGGPVRSGCLAAKPSRAFNYDSNILQGTGGEKAGPHTQKLSLLSTACSMSA